MGAKLHVEPEAMDSILQLMKTKPLWTAVY